MAVIAPHFSGKHRPALRGLLILVVLLVPLHLAQIVTGTLLIIQHISMLLYQNIEALIIASTYLPGHLFNELTLQGCVILLSVPTISALHREALRSTCKCVSCCRLTRPVVLFCWVFTIFLFSVPSHQFTRSPMKSHQWRILSRGLRRSSCDDALKQTLFKWRQRCILGFLFVVPIQLPRGFLLFWPNPLVMDLLSVLSGPIHYLSFLLLVLRITSRGSSDEDIALGPILPQSGDADAPVQDSPDAVNPDESNTSEPYRSSLEAGKNPAHVQPDGTNQLLEPQSARSKAVD
ncbi:uncharacterized protein EI90DRAFT_3046321 [Cantharellus anzutake]|uniref:uncharacterized protein n=1 Tax=Cantharellus anzutake TaxID=1750568 RepID=UPI0019046234|nr:uncharacterized protein EI90DRAFT_3046321 [Cantharellus anzutake]KAF8336595.1 hypothetical protein EI90DRAFT_3046321 [Cantharellus anzutake]